MNFLFENKIVVIDEIINKEYQLLIKKNLFDNFFPWYFTSDVTHSEDNFQQRPGFSHQFINLKTSKIVSSLHKLLVPLIQESCKAINFNITKITQGRSFLQLPLNLKENTVDTPHIDDVNRHLVVLYYVNDSDGDTIIYENLYDKKNKMIFNNLKIKQKVSPKMGRVVLFDGWLYHTASQPRNDNRCIINYNVI